MFHLFDTYAAGISLLCSALFEAIAVSWFYGNKISSVRKRTSKIKTYCGCRFEKVYSRRRRDVGHKTGALLEDMLEIHKSVFYYRKRLSNRVRQRYNNFLSRTLGCRYVWSNLPSAASVRRLQVSELGRVGRLVFGVVVHNDDTPDCYVADS